MPHAPLKNIDLYYETHGDSTDPCVILIMGFGGQLTQWPRTFIDALVSVGFFVVVFDNRDAGKSTFRKAQEEINLNEVFAAVQKGGYVKLPYSLDDMAIDVVELMDFLNIQAAHIVGGSVGGMIAQLLAADHPKRVRSLTCIGSSSGDKSLTPPSPEVQMALMHFTQPSSSDFPSHLERRLSLFKLYNPHANDEDIAFMTDVAEVEFERRQPGNSLARQILAVTTAPDRLAELKKIHIPSLIIHGEDDPVFPLDHGEQLHQLIADSEFHVVERMGHGFIPSMVPQVSRLIIDFLTGRALDK